MPDKPAPKKKDEDDAVSSESDTESESEEDEDTVRSNLDIGCYHYFEIAIPFKKNSDTIS